MTNPQSEIRNPRWQWARSSLGFLRRLAVAAHQDKILFLASALAFDGLLAALPFALLILGATGYLLHVVGASPADVHGLLERFFPAHEAGGTDPFGGFESLATEVAANRGQLSVWAAPFFLWFATRFYGTVRRALSVVFGTSEPRRFLVGLVVDVWLVVVTTLLFVGNALLSAQTLFTGWFGRFLGVLSAFGFGVVLFFVVYAVAPSRRVRPDTAFLAAVVTSLAFEVAKKLFALYLAQFATLDRLVSNANVIAVFLFIFWLYYMACAFLVGAEVANGYDSVRGRGERAFPT